MFCYKKNYPWGKGVGRKIFRGGPKRIEPVLTTKNGRIFEIWEVLERVRENPGEGHGPPLPPPLADAHALSYSKIKLYGHEQNLSNTDRLWV